MNPRLRDMPAAWATLAGFAVVVGLSSYGVLVTQGIQGGTRNVGAFITLMVCIGVLARSVVRLRQLRARR